MTTYLSPNHSETYTTKDREDKYNYLTLDGSLMVLTFERGTAYFDGYKTGPDRLFGEIAPLQFF